jgi:hypothetical protein
MSKNVGLAVVTYKDNFGSALQTYATQTVIRNMGFNTGIFDITGVHKEINKKKIKYYITRVFQSDEFKYLLENLKSRGRKKANVKNDKYAENMRVRHAKYTEFNNKWLEFKPHVKSWKELTEQSSKCDYVVVGSDQLWRPSNIAGEFFTLEFVPENVKKVAFSTSFGVSELPKSLHKHARNYLNRIDDISVREDTGKNIVLNLTGREIPVVCDPTMMLDAQQWMEIQDKEPIIKEKYILCYFMGDNPVHREFAQKLKKATGYKIVGLLHGATYIPSDEDFADEAPYDIGPGEFINLIRNAEYMCTDSFHGTVFSILNSTEFFTFRRYSDTSEFSTNDRIHTLLKWTGLSERLLYGTEDVKEYYNRRINFTEALSKVQQKREDSFDYLKNALNITEGLLCQN